MRRRRLATGGLYALALAGLVADAACAQEASSGGVALERFRWPLRGAILKDFKAGESDGIEIAAPVGEPVHAAADGVCIYAGDELKTYGKLVLIRHANDFVTAYADLSEIEVKEGDPVRRGQIIAKAGQSGDAATPRLHFELRKDGKAIDPIRYLVPL